MQIEQFQWA